MESVIQGRPRHQREVDRLRIQHKVVLGFTQGKLLLAPVDLTTPGLRVLDSGTAKADWLLDLYQAMRSNKTATLVGTDIADEHFPPANELPPTVTLQKQSIFDPWPVQWQSSFDVVHQRFVLAACQSHAQAYDALTNMVMLVKPGGWIELHEGDMTAIQEGPGHESMVRFRDIAVAAWKQLGNVADMGPNLGRWLRQLELDNVSEVKQIAKIGPAADDPEQGEDALYLCLNMFDAIQRIVTGKDGFPSDQEFGELRVALEKELRVTGNQWNYHLAYGQRTK